MDAMNEMIKQMVEEQVKSRLETEVKTRVEAELKSRPTIAPPQTNMFDPERFMRIAFAFRGETDMWRMLCLTQQVAPERFAVYGTPHLNRGCANSSAPFKISVRFTINERYFVPIHFYGNVVTSGAFMVESADIVLRRSEPPVFLGNLSLSKSNWADNLDKMVTSGGTKSSVSQ